MKKPDKAKAQRERWLNMTPEQRRQETEQWLLGMSAEQVIMLMTAIEEILEIAGDGDDRRTVAQVLAGRSH